ncbi:MAG: DNA repair protein RecN [Bacteroidota bacterium]
MLSWLKIKNYLLIEHLDIQIPDGFITMTGETGAGKSILLGAIALLTGKRADTSVLMDESGKCIVEAGFTIKNNNKGFFDKYDIDFDTETIIRREISGKGKSRAFINDTPVKLDVLKKLTDKLIDIHSQHQSLLVGTSDFRLSVLDSFADTATERRAYHKVYSDYAGCIAELNALSENYSQAVREKDYLQFQFDQLENAVLIPNELSELEQEEALLNHAEEIQSNLMQSVHLLRDDQNNCIDALSHVNAMLENIKAHFGKADEYAGRIESVSIELKDLADSFEQDASSIEFNPARLEELRQRINLLNDLLLKHQKNSVDELIHLRENIGEKLLAFDTDSSRIEELQNESEKLFAELKKRGEILSAKRKSAIPGLEKKLKSMLAYLGMPDAGFHVRFTEREKPGESGLDKADFLFSANRDMPEQPIEKVASGGEMSRLMLCLKTILARKLHMPTIIFDEIDTGVSGEIAGKMGKMMLQLGDTAQVISITHLAQVAALGKRQLYVSKNKSRTSIHILSEEERLKEIARMSSGENVSEAAIAHARNLLQDKKTGKQ